MKVLSGSALAIGFGLCLNLLPVCVSCRFSVVQPGDLSKKGRYEAVSRYDR